jgi:Skp family chaperone for outer membrane proteins
LTQPKPPGPRVFKVIQDEYFCTVYDESEFDQIPDLEEGEELLHVIEKSYADKLEAELREVKAEVAKLQHYFHEDLDVQLREIAIERDQALAELAQLKEYFQMSVKAKPVELQLMDERDAYKGQLDRIKAGIDSRMDGWTLLAFIDKILKGGAE